MGEIALTSRLRALGLSAHDRFWPISAMSDGAGLRGRTSASNSYLMGNLREAGDNLSLIAQFLPQK